MKAEAVSFVPGVSFSGAPSYVSEFAGRFRDNGGPLSPFASHAGIKAEVRSNAPGGVLHFACATGKHVLDYSQTGLFATSSVVLATDQGAIEEALERNIEFSYFGWEEEARLQGFELLQKASFLGTDQYLLSIRIKNTSPGRRSVSPLLRFEKNSRFFHALREGESGRLIVKFSVRPFLWPRMNCLAVIPSEGAGISAGRIEIKEEQTLLGPGESEWYSWVLAFSPDSKTHAQALSERGQNSFSTPDDAWQSSLAMMDGLSLPKPHLAPGDKSSLELYLMSAAALENALYAPRENMRHFGCVPTKVHYNWFWLWDSGFQALGYGEYRPARARDAILTMLGVQEKEGFISHMTNEWMEPLTPHSQPPVFGFAGARIVHPSDPGSLEFTRTMYESSKPFLEWWSDNRDRNNNGLFEYLSQDEGGWDNSPRADYVKKMMFIPYYGNLGEILGSKIKPLESVDLNSWMYSYYLAMARWAGELGLEQEADDWREKADVLAQKIDALLWDQEAKAWFDTYSWVGSDKYHHFKVLTPAIWFPAFLGATRDEAKARAVIEEHLLDPDEFFGKYPVPTVAYNDPRFDRTESGWKSHIWLVTAYSALEALFRFGYEDEAEELRERLLEMMADQDGMKGIYETYDPLTGKYKSEYSKGGYSSFQFGWSSAFTMEMILERHQGERFVFEHTAKVKGHVRRAIEFSGRSDFFYVEAGRDLPLVELESQTEAPLLNAPAVRLKLTDPYGSLSQSSFRVFLKGRPFSLEIGKDYVISLDDKRPAR